MDRIISTFEQIRYFSTSHSIFNIVSGDQINLQTSTPSTPSTPEPLVEPDAGVRGSQPGCACSERSETELSDSENYARLLLAKKQGFPLWLPEPFANLPSDYRDKGVRIGDLGIITSDGGFDFLFNICLPADHPVNLNRVPPGFQPLRLDDDCDIRHIPNMHSRGCDISSSSVKMKEVNFDSGFHDAEPSTERIGAKFTFTCSPTEGALLVVPHGASRCNLLPLDRFHGFAEAHVHSWYDFVNGELGRAASNGSLYLVTGTDKARSWGVGSYSNGSSEASIRLNVSVTQQSDAVVFNHIWEKSGRVATRCGPGRLLENENQTIFIRGFKLAIGKDQRNTNSVAEQVEILHTNDSDANIMLERRRDIPGRQGSPNSERSVGSGITNHSGVVTLTFPTVSEPYHPLTVINNHLLNVKPGAKLVITHDHDWMSVITDDDDRIPDEQELLQRVVSQHDVVEKDGCVLLQPKSVILSPNSVQGLSDKSICSTSQTQNKDKPAQGWDQPDLAVQRLADLLGDVEIPFRPLDDPTAWLNAETQQRRDVMGESSIFSEDELADVVNDLVYPRTRTYTLAHIKLRAHENKSSLLEALKAKQRDWNGLGQMPRLIGHRSIRDALFDFLLRSDPTNTSPRRRVPTHIRKMLKLDVMGIAARTLELLHDPQAKALLLGQSGDVAQSTLDHLQGLLDLPEFGAQIRSPILSAISVLTQRSGLYPKCFDLQGITIQQLNPSCVGGFANIYKVDWYGHTVAVKVPLAFGLGVERMKRFAREAVIWRQLTHPNVLPFYGVHRFDDDDGPRLGLVSPWMDNDTIMEYLKFHAEVDRPSLSLDVASGLEYLHNFNPAVIHGDLKGTNILMTASGRACLADFGLCTIQYDALVPSDSTTGAKFEGTYRYQAPELIAMEDNSESQMRERTAADIYSFGCVAYEVFLGRPCFAQMDISKVTNSLPSRPPADFCKEVDLDDTIWNLLGSCLETNSADRPTATKLVQILRSHLETRDVAKPGACWDNAVTHLRSRLVEDYLSTEAFMDISDFPPTSAPFVLRRESLMSAQSAGMRPILEDDIIIALMGPTGTGKSSFINTATGSASVGLSNALSSGTQEVHAISCPYPDDSGRNVIFLDTPGFDDTGRTDFDILEDIAKWLKKTYENEVTLSGILYFHSISESRMRGTPMKNLSMFRELCGENAFQNLIFTTTMWDELGEDSIVGVTREHELRTKFWKPMMDRGCRIARFTGTRESAWKIISTFNHEPRRPVNLQEELVDKGMMKPTETSAYTLPINWWNLAISKLRLVLRVAKGRKAPSLQESGSSPDSWSDN